jgi:hypothetical protein
MVEAQGSIPSTGKTEKLGVVAHTCNPCHSRSRDREDHGLGPDRQKVKREKCVTLVKKKKTKQKELRVWLKW